jgi:ubiquinone/menaquinone biosynthesis C-methylase UbiE
MQQLQYSVDLDITNLNTYEIISSEFAETRAYVWQCVKDFTKLIKENSSVLEIGCGNGKNMKYILDRIHCNTIGIDTCHNFVDMCRDKNLKVSNKNILNLEFDDNTFDYILCVAVFHHLLNIDDQDRAMNEILRVMKPKSIGMITCWSTEQPDDSKFIFSEGINIVMWKGRKDLNKTRYYYVYSESMFREFFNKYNINILKIYNEVGNWIILFEKN